MKKKALFIIMALAVTAAMAQGGGWGRGPGFKYDSSAETRLTGTIEEIKTTDSICRTGTHLILKTNQGNTEVALGPAQFLKDQSVLLSKGDQIEVVGAKANTGRGEMFVVRQLITGGKTVTLRDEKGVPAWPRGSCR
jgi:hypothetical protein